MSKEKYIGEAALKDKPGKKLTLVIKDGSVTTNKVANEAVTTPKIANEAVVTDKIANENVTNEKLAGDSVTTSKIKDESVTTEKLAESSVETSKIKKEAITNDKMAQDSVGTEQVINESIVNSKLSKNAVSTEKLQDGSVTNEKMAKDSLTKDKLDPELRKALDAAVGLPDDLVTMIQDVDKNLNKLNDTVYPIILGFTINPNVSTMKTDVIYSVKSDNEYLVPDTLSITKKVNDTAETILTNYPTSNSSLITPIQGAREIFKFAVTKEGRTSQSISQTKYLCYYGGNAESTMTAEILNTLSRVSTTGIAFDLKVTTKDNDYIWLVVPSYLSISRVTSAGFDVTLAAPQTITNSLGSFKAYRTANPLTAATWNLVIS
uniref:Tail fiber protein n=1 Tax=CrAss-like virus sp. ctcfK29 TaxID=2826827 RepID=A0A8S5MIY6_9CAUD|nr:MAG TPA: Tail fiber protein [CrAss-like virus sp. ctcfK29]